MHDRHLTRRRPGAAGLRCLALPLLAACTDNTSSVRRRGDNADPRALTVQATDTACTLSAADGAVRQADLRRHQRRLEGHRVLPAGRGRPADHRRGREHRPRAVPRPGAHRRPGHLLHRLQAGHGRRRHPRRLRGHRLRRGHQPARAREASSSTTANASYQAYVKDQTEQLVTKTNEFAELYKSGKDDEARALYAAAREHWERIETVAESFGDLDPKMDLREADLEPGQEWTGWHRIEKDLWPARAKNYEPLDDAGRREVRRRPGRQHRRRCTTGPATLTFTADQIANGSRGLLDEVATGKVTGEEEYWSRTDLWDFQANVDGARVGFDGLRPLLQERDPDARHARSTPSSSRCRRCSTRSATATVSCSTVS